MTDRIARCGRCGTPDAEAPEGTLVFISRNLFGPRVERALCRRCFGRGLWQKWRLLIAAGSVAFALYGLWTAQWVGVGVAVMVGGVWWAISSRAIAGYGRADEPAP